jgi:hypothetical protein
MPDNKGKSTDRHTHTLIIFNIYCFSTVTMVTQKCLNVTIYVCRLPCLTLNPVGHKLSTGLKWLNGDKQRNVGVRRLKFGMEVEYKHTYQTLYEILFIHQLLQSLIGANFCCKGACILLTGAVQSVHETSDSDSSIFKSPTPTPP